MSKRPGISLKRDYPGDLALAYKGYIDVQKLTCAQLVNTYQEDADFLGIWYSGWYNGLAKKHAINVPRVKEGIHNVIVHCKANQGKTIIQAIDFILKAEQKR